jgi:hypothetical protein
MGRGRVASCSSSRLPRRLPSRLGGGFLSVAAVVLAGACSSAAPPSLEETSVRAFTNGGFETGAAGATPPSWPVTPYLNNDITVQTPQTLAGLDLLTMLAGHSAPKNLTTTLNAPGGPLSKIDPDLGAGASLRWPRYGNQCALVNQHSSTNFGGGPTGNGQNVNSMAQTMTIGAGDVDPADGLVHVRFVVAPVLQNPAHPADEQPYYFVQLTDLTTTAILYSDFNLSGAAGIPWKTVNGGTPNEIDYTDWQLVDISPSGGSLAMGDKVELQIIASGCQPGGHFGEIYVDGAGATVPGLFVVGTGPAQANQCSNVTYTLTYENGGATPAAGVSITFNTPPQTTYQSVTAPGLVCTNPGVGNAGAVVCTDATPLGAGVQGSLQVTVKINCAATGIVTAGNYWIQGTGVTPLLGPHVNTTIGCSLDSQCIAGNWCDETLSQCTPTFSNGTAVPNDPSHTNPTINGTCTAAAGAVVCTSAVCDADNKCGYKNGDGACTAANGAVVCRSGACDPDGKCGYANGDGPCTAVDGGVVCRSGACSVSGECEPAGGCDVDADCSAGNWCAESTHTCTPKIANGGPVPTDGPHTNPTLNGVCTAGAGALVCVSAVCDTHDNKCGYANGDGPCTALDGGVVCRSGACSSNLTCEPVGGCNVDADCTAANWCDESTHTCTPKLANGTIVPTDPPHTGPSLNGMCTVAAGALVCLSGVCDVNDNECGYANGDGPCTVPTGPTECRSGACSLGGTCEPAGGCAIDADCTTSQYCNTPTSACVPKLPNGQPVPTVTGHTPTLNGTCTALAGASACVSGVCDVNDNDCGYANGDGPCTGVTGGVVCRSGTCSTNLTCEPAGGCDVDADCTGGDWCDESTHVCTAPLANGTPVPTDPPHVGPALNGTCTAAAGTLVCASTVCDTKDNECGYANGDGPCTVATATECRSGTCSPTGGVCIPSAGCVVDSDCSVAQYCNTPTNLCVTKVPNGQDVPTVTGHTPTLDGTCTAAAGTAACASGVCDTNDNKCGYANGDGPCTATDGATDCRSAECSTNLTCEPAGGCNVDADCATGTWCLETIHQCVAQSPNGTAVPTDPTHTNPTLNGTCTAAAGTLVCVSGVCDVKDNKCGYANGDGPCTASDGTADCRSMTCATSGTNAGLCVACIDNAECPAGSSICDTGNNTCVQCTASSQCPMDTPVCNTASGTCATACTTDANCPNADWCDITTGTDGLCTPKIPNGKPLPTTPSSVATCSAAVGKRVCVSGVCDSVNNTCGATPDAGTPDAGTGCKNDGECGGGKYCDAGTCVPTLPLGQACDRNPECTQADCAAGICSEIVSSGAGVFCAVQAPGNAGGDADWSVIGVMLGLAGVSVGRRRRRAA